ncbi:ATP-binding protein [Oxalobacter aliiformigenes]|uniref:ATP-binding protein n=1 Tax=Oxalobacter aliiformigenes TaxID=2946593 RepID=A0A9E9LC12_9BURK|nr:ATP-binding protein [Oxalobacter aliiformigenes]WAV91612.1 ATP-binding protein [Oxalobacter aliiformigenes]WAV93702.1 ATP-binding protein [Oxalobacter aliiformigenes]WAV94793.1 ATP-binding protein [Oxalobacter aliiformigenes]WAV97397.1 ATP-binding protein [Oxalobacter aliiformigenes]
MTTLEQFLERAESVLTRLENLLPSQTATSVDWDSPTAAFRWRKKNGRGALVPIARISPVSLPDLFFVERQKTLLEQNTRQFLQGKPANNVLLTGARGTGKSSLVKACLNEFSDQGLRLIEVDKNDLVDLDEISELIASRPESFILYCDDLSFDEGDSSYKALKVALDGSVAAQPDNILIYATSNRRHLLPEKMSDNDGYSRNEDGDLHPSETVEEKISFSDRFGLWLSFYPYSQDEYLFIMAHWLRSFGCTEDQISAATQEALQWALHRGSRSGRTAWQFARDYAGRIL